MFHANESKRFGEKSLHKMDIGPKIPTESDSSRGLPSLPDGLVGLLPRPALALHGFPERVPPLPRRLAHGRGAHLPLRRQRHLSTGLIDSFPNLNFLNGNNTK
jgi:hypothetical protein